MRQTKGKTDHAQRYCQFISKHIVKNIIQYLLYSSAKKKHFFKDHSFDYLLSTSRQNKWYATCASLIQSHLFCPIFFLLAMKQHFHTEQILYSSLFIFINTFFFISKLPQ